VRFGATENLYGSAEIAAFRHNRPTTDLQRQMIRLQVVTFGHDTGSVTLEFRRSIQGEMRHGRQSQVWRKIGGEWKIVSAHVSLMPQ
jgi:hypothetical protein